jgi:hypothetical protein
MLTKMAVEVLSALMSHARLMMLEYRLPHLFCWQWIASSASSLQQHTMTGAKLLLLR